MRKAMNDSPDNTYHVPVLLEAVMQYMAPEKGKTIVDGTLGGGGHSEAMLKAGARVIGIDQDEQALAFAQQRLGVFDGAFTALRGNFSKLPSILANAGVEKVDGILVDIGVSSWQLDEAERGFSFGKEGPLDMRMDRSVGETAADWVNHRSEQELKTLFYEFGEERAGAKIARRIVARRQQKAFTTTTDLADFIASIIPRGKGPRGKIHPATRVFQALRIAVNDELGVLRELLASAAALLHPGGRLLVITFHSLEDRIVKQFFKKVSQRYIDRKEWPEPRLNPDFEYQLITRRPVIATDDEIQSNKRSRSAKLRVVEKI
ncbi:MAG: 16S rRNA (cytosine(1402)-N(4))-methyltransferase RsmH [Verrucomicrobiae bacterium]|nr:16S rRNA (cytosine(1402)-N(4))-methyltransferase RsmH [Verrucomicrobiae bacterium]NNJ43962.1 16S rRNA (cytosine(1402)-N(4))-methyltransferase RsmH [Akkermansiaceae bacterium]